MIAYSIAAIHADAVELKAGERILNDAHAHITGDDRKKVEKSSFIEVTKDRHSKIGGARHESIGGGDLLQHSQELLQCRPARGGQVRWSSSTWEPLRDESGRQIGYLGTEFDITERSLTDAVASLLYFDPATRRSAFDRLSSGTAPDAQQAVRFDRHVAEAVDEVGGIGKCQPSGDEGRVHPQRLTRSAFPDLRQSSSMRDLPLFAPCRWSGLAGSAIGAP